MNISVYKENAGTAEDNIVTPDVVQNRFGISYNCDSSSNCSLDYNPTINWGFGANH